MEGQPVRFTLDRQVECAVRATVRPPERPAGGAGFVPDGYGIVEIKFAEALPRAFQDLFHRLGMSHASFSKYRLGVSALGLVTGEALQNAARLNI